MTKLTTIKLIVCRKILGLNQFIKLLSLISFFAITSCKSSYKIPAEDLKLIPYKGHEELIFKSNKNARDTIILQGFNNYDSPLHSWEFPIKIAQHIALVSKRSSATGSTAQVKQDSMSLIMLANNGITYITIQFTAYNAWFYSIAQYTKKEFLNLPTTSLKIGQQQLIDVIVMKPDRWVSERELQRDNAIIKLFWSKKYGVIRYDKSDGEIWELQNFEQIKWR